MMEQRIPRLAVPSTSYARPLAVAASPSGARPRRGRGGGAGSRAGAPASPQRDGGGTASLPAGSGGSWCTGHRPPPQAAVC
jgi:hypothetical protein